MGDRLNRETAYPVDKPQRMLTAHVGTATEPLAGHTAISRRRNRTGGLQIKRLVVVRRLHPRLGGREGLEPLRQRKGR